MSRRGPRWCRRTLKAVCERARTHLPLSWMPTRRVTKGPSEVPCNHRTVGTEPAGEGARDEDVTSVGVRSFHWIWGHSGYERRHDRDRLVAFTKGRLSLL